MKRNVLALAALIAIGTGCTREEEAVTADAAFGDEAVVEQADLGNEELATPDPAGDVATFGRWDASRDGMLGVNEFNAALNEGGRFDEWDVDNDGLVNETEFETVNAGWGDDPVNVARNRSFEDWDADGDGRIDNDEFNAGVYSAWDRDANQLIDTTEYDAGINWFGWG